jgi:hypothetical protein
MAMCVCGSKIRIDLGHERYQDQDSRSRFHGRSGSRGRVLEWHGVVDMKSVYHLGGLVVSNTMIVLGEECMLSMSHICRLCSLNRVTKHHLSSTFYNNLIVRLAGFFRNESFGFLPPIWSGC